MKELKQVKLAITLLLATTLMCSLVGCGGGSASDASNDLPPGSVAGNFPADEHDEAAGSQETESQESLEDESEDMTLNDIERSLEFSHAELELASDENDSVLTFQLTNHSPYDCNVPVEVIGEGVFSDAYGDPETRTFSIEAYILPSEGGMHNTVSIKGGQTDVFTLYITPYERDKAFGECDELSDVVVTIAGGAPGGPLPRVSPRPEKTSYYYWYATEDEYTLNNEEVYLNDEFPVSGGYTMQGTITNNTDVAWSHVSIRYWFYDDAGNFVDTIEMFAEYIKPGDSKDFEAEMTYDSHFTDIDKAAGYKLAYVLYTADLDKE